MAKQREVDVAIIGAGSAGMNAYSEVQSAGKSCLLIEGGEYGTTCARVGCMPSKLVIAAADVAHTVADADRFGIVTDDWRVDAAAVFERVRRYRDRFVSGVVDKIESFPEEHRLRGCVRFVEPNVLEVDGHGKLTAAAVIIATGSQPRVPPPLRSIADHAWFSDDIFELERLPETLAVIGTGIVGLELGQALDRLGVHVTFFDRTTHPGPFSDPELQKCAREIFGERLDVRLEVEITGARYSDGEFTLEWEGAEGDANRGSYERVLVAAGRAPNIEGLNLEALGLPLDERGLPPWDPRTTQCADLPVFLAGDVSGHVPLLHEAADEGRIAGRNASLFPQVTAHVRRTPLAIAFCHPQLATAGERYADLDPDDICVGELDFSGQGRAMVTGRAEGLVRLYARKSDCVLVGMEMLGPEAEHLAHLMAWTISCGLPVQRILEQPFYHPVLEEGLRTALRDLAKQLQIEGDCRAEDMAESAGH